VDGVAIPAWKCGPERARVIDLNRNSGVHVGPWWSPVVKYVLPVVIVFIIGYGVVTSIGTENQTLMLLGVGLMATLVVVSTVVMSIIGTSPEDTTDAADSTPARGGD